jgi:hypothetical protein
MSLLESLRISGRYAASKAFDQDHSRRFWLIAVLHIAALGVMLSFEEGWVEKAAFLLAWGILNSLWLAMFRRPAIAASLSLAFVVALIVLSRLKHDIVSTTVSFLDVLIIDNDTVSFLLMIYPGLRLYLIAGAVAALPLIWLIWRYDPFRVPRLRAAATGTACLGALIGLSLAVPEETWMTFRNVNHVSKFARSGVVSVAELMNHGWFDASAAMGADTVEHTAAFKCQPAKKPPHILIVHDESSFDVRAIPNLTVPAGYGAHFKSYDGRERKFLVESNGGSSWFAEYNVLTGLSSRSFGRFSYFLTRVAADRVNRGLPEALKECGYRTFSLYPAQGAFMSARRFHKTTGIEHFFDARALGTNRIEPDGFYYDAAAGIIERQRRQAPMFMFIYLAANHFPWTDRWRPELHTSWRDLGNPPKIDEYLRRQEMSAQDYAKFIARLKKQFPDESFLILRYGDHQPEFAMEMIEPGIDEYGAANRMATFDLRHFTTYYAIDTVNYQPKKSAAASDLLDAPYTPMAILELAGLPLDATFVEQRQIFQRCKGIFYACRDGAEARRFNRFLIDAGLIKGL